jgi:hypothetical protein
MWLRSCRHWSRPWMAEPGRRRSGRDASGRGPRLPRMTRPARPVSSPARSRPSSSIVTGPAKIARLARHPAPPWHRASVGRARWRLRHPAPPPCTGCLSLCMDRARPPGRLRPPCGLNPPRAMRWSEKAITAGDFQSRGDQNRPRAARENQGREARPTYVSCRALLLSYRRLHRLLRLVRVARRQMGSCRQPRCSCGGTPYGRGLHEGES